MIIFTITFAIFNYMHNENTIYNTDILNKYNINSKENKDSNRNINNIKGSMGHIVHQRINIPGLQTRLCK